MTFIAAVGDFSAQPRPSLTSFKFPFIFHVDRVVEVFAKHTSKGDKKLEFRVIRLINQHDQDELPDYSTNWYFTPWNKKTTMRMQKQGPTKLLGTTPDMDYAGTINGPFEQLHANPDTPVIFIIPAWPEFKEIRYMQLRNYKTYGHYNPMWQQPTDSFPPPDKAAFIEHKSKYLSL